MSLSTIIISIVLIALLALTIRYLIKNGTCSSCDKKNLCHGICSGGCHHSVKDPIKH
jgi:hypothetical protein